MKLTIKQKLLTIAITSFFSLTVMFLISYFTGQTVKHNSDLSTLRSHQMEDLRHIQLMQNNLSLHAMDIIADSGNSELINKLSGEVDEIVTEIEKDIVKLKSLADTDDEAVYIRNIDNDLKILVSTIQKGLVPAALADDSMQIASYDDTIDEKSENLIENIDLLVTSIKSETLAAENELNSSISSSVIIGLVVFLGFGIALFGILYLLGRGIIYPINQVVETAREFTKGNRNVKVTYNNPDEIGVLANSINDMISLTRKQLRYLDTLPTPVMLCDPEFNVEYMNEYAAQVVNHTQEACVGKKCYSLFKTEHCQTDNCAVYQAMKQNKQVGAETIARPQGSDIHIMYTGAPIHDDNGEVVGAIEYVANISEIKEMHNYMKRCTSTMLIETDKFAKGDLTIHLQSEKDDDDVARMFSGFNNAVNKLHQMVVDVQEAVSATASASAEISSATEQLAAGAQEQSAQSADVASAVEQMTSTIVETSQNTQSAAQAAKEAGDKAKEGVERVKETKNGMEKIVITSQSTAEIIHSLTQNADQIGNIASVISDIADQTNLLALNAAIEAARAGEQGRGFAVVADEVRKLAERTTNATKEIAETIKGIQKQVKDAEDSMEESKSVVNKGMNLTDQVSSVLQEILISSTRVSEVIEQVASASEEQSATAEQISRSIESINTVSQQSAASTSQIAATAEDLNRLTEGLQNMISVFRVATGKNYAQGNLRIHSNQYAVRSNGKLLKEGVPV